MAARMNAHKSLGPPGNCTKVHGLGCSVCNTPSTCQNSGAANKGTPRPKGVASNNAVVHHAQVSHGKQKMFEPSHCLNLLFCPKTTMHQLSW
eukprot:CAMPEP_0117615892 /NCGR_PEP_ID=MMETSP0784-20121206/84768_1 /TAXON_ID=39447 /ORGANISM="" /LENGTH=91 /DNA_ID=CAMNT_0005419631 /DNA_START=50 /DNA_END=322 /DNA_ORIENTATION=-